MVTHFCSFSFVYPFILFDMYGSSQNSNSLPTLTSSLIYKHVNALALMRSYLELDIDPFIGFTCPDWLRKALNSKPDKNPSCSVYVKGSNVTFNDFGIGFRGDVFNIIKLKYNCDYNQALIKVAEDYGIEYYGRQSIITELKKFDQDSSSIVFNKEYTDIRYKVRQMTQQDYNFWKSFGIPLATLKMLNIFLAESVWVNGELKYVYRPHDPAFIYAFNESTVKVYFPYRKSHRFLMNINGKHYMEGMESLDRFGDKLVITKSYKDVAFIRSLSIQSVNPSSESVLVNSDIMQNLHSRFGEQFLLFDNDTQGKKMSDIYKAEFPYLNQIFIPEGYSKDITDTARKFGRAKAKEVLDSLIS
jgi:5S rRNA maturation endonuclease (ribonuclease M5)